MKKIRKGDNVIVMAGKHKGSKGAVTQVLRGNMVLVEAVNRVKRHTRANPQRQDRPGGIIEKEMPLPISKIALFNPATKKGDRVGIRVMQDGRRARYFKSNGEVIDV